MAKDVSSLTSIGGLAYSIPEYAHTIILPSQLLPKLSRFTEDLIPTTVIEWSGTKFGPGDLEATRERLSAADDVWTGSFLSCKLPHGHHASRSDCWATDIVLILLLPAHGNIDFRSKRIVCLERSRIELTEGPYVVSRATGHVFPVMRLFPDPNEAFISAVCRNSCSDSAFKESAVRMPSKARGLELTMGRPGMAYQCPRGCISIETEGL